MKTCDCVLYVDETPLELESGLRGRRKGESEERRVEKGEKGR